MDPSTQQTNNPRKPPNRHSRRYLRSPSIGHARTLCQRPRTQRPRTMGTIPSNRSSPHPKSACTHKPRRPLRHHRRSTRPPTTQLSPQRPPTPHLPIRGPRRRQCSRSTRHRNPKNSQRSNHRRAHPPTFSDQALSFTAVINRTYTGTPTKNLPPTQTKGKTAALTKPERRLLQAIGEQDLNTLQLATALNLTPDAVRKVLRNLVHQSLVIPKRWPRRPNHKLQPYQRLTHSTQQQGRKAFRTTGNQPSGTEHYVPPSKHQGPNSPSETVIALRVLALWPRLCQNAGLSNVVKLAVS